MSHLILSFYQYCFRVKTRYKFLEGYDLKVYFETICQSRKALIIG